MAYLSQLASVVLQNTRQTLTSCDANLAKICVRYASKKASTSTRNKPGHPRPKHRGWRVQDGSFVQAGTILATQLTTRFHPGLNVGFGRNGTLFAIESGKVFVTCEKADLNMEHTWVQQNYASRTVLYKKYFNVVPEPQHKNFKLINAL